MERWFVAIGTDHFEKIFNFDPSAYRIEEHRTNPKEQDANAENSTEKTKDRVSSFLVRHKI